MKDREQKPAQDYQFEALQGAVRYRQALIREFGPYLRGEVVEVGAGTGLFTEQLAGVPSITMLKAIEPDPALCAQHRQTFPGHRLYEGVFNDVANGWTPDAIVSVNVLEHIRDDEQELALYARALRARSGYVCLFVPARPELFAPIDADFAHYRRYTRHDLAAKLSRAGFATQHMYYYNFPGYFLWMLRFRMLRRRSFGTRRVQFYDRRLFPLIHWAERHIARPPIGQNLLAVARIRG